MNIRTASLALFPAASLLILVACGGGGSTPAPAPAVAVSISPNPVPPLLVGGTQTFTATVTGNANTSVTWSVTEGAGGTITTGGVYTAPMTPGTYHVVATSVADATKHATATVTVTPPPATALAYTDPTTGTYRLVKNVGLSTSTHLVLDVTGVGSSANGAGIAFTYTVDTTRATWAKVAGTDAEYIQAGDVFTLGNVPYGIKGKVATTTLTAGLGQKGLTSPAPVALNGVLARVALDLKSGAPTGTATLTAPKAQIIAADGTITTVTVVPGTLSAQ